MRKPTERKINGKYFGTYFMKADSKNRVTIPSNLEQTLVHRNSLDESVEDPEAVILHFEKNEIICYDSVYFKKIQSRTDYSRIYPSRVDLAKRILIPKEIVENYPLVNPLKISASKDGEYFTIRSARK